MAYLGNHSATDSRDRIFSVLGLITARDRALIGAPEYSSSVEHQFAKLVRSFWNEYGNLDIICFVHCSAAIPHLSIVAQKMLSHAGRQIGGLQRILPHLCPSW